MEPLLGASRPVGAAATAAVNVGTQRDTDFVRKAPRHFFVGLYVVGVALFATWGYYLYLPGGPDNNTSPWPLSLCMPLAKMCGRVLTLTLCLLMLTAMRTTASWVRKLPYLRFLLPLDALIPDFHRALAYTAAVAAVGHVVFHTVDFIVLGGSVQLPWTGGFCVTFSGERTSICLVYTGALAASLLAAIVVIALVYFARVRRMMAASAAAATANTPGGKARQRNNFASLQIWFTMVAHWILVPLFVLVLSLHAQSKGYSYVAIPFWVLSVALYIDVRLRYRGTKVKVVHKPAADLEAASAPAGLYTEQFGNILRLVVARPPGFTFKAGQSALLHVDFGRASLAPAATPWLHRWQYHPFTIACSPAAAEATGVLVFLIRDQNNQGSWTTALHQAAASLDEITIAGPNGAPYEYYDGFETVLLVGTGAGVTPLAAIFGSMANDEIAARASTKRRPDNSYYGSVSIHASINGGGNGSGTDDDDRHHLSGAEDDDDKADKGDGSSTTSSSGSAASHDPAAATLAATTTTAAARLDSAVASAVLSPRLLLYTCIVVLAATLAIGVYVILNAASIVYDWIMVMVELLVTGAYLVPLFTLRLYYLLARAVNPMPAEWILELLLLVLAVGGAGVASWCVAILAGTNSTDGDAVYWFLWLLLSIQGGLTVLLVLARSLVFIYYRAPFAADRIRGRAIAFRHRTVQFLAFVDRPMQAGLASVLVSHTDALRASSIDRDQFSVVLCAGKGLDPIPPESSLAAYVETATKTAEELATDSYDARFAALVDGRLIEAHKRRHQRLNHIGVFFCGAPKLSASLYATVQRVECEHTLKYGCNCYVSFHEERFV